MKRKTKMINILPVNDLKEHDEHTTCDCKPSVEVVNGVMIVTHNSYDKRELSESKSLKNVNIC